MGRLVAQLPNEDPRRLARVMDAKFRTIGIDKDALQGQVEDRKNQEATERERDRQYGRLAQHFDQQLCSQQVASEAERRKANEDLNSFRNSSQGKHTSREWDLNRPDAKLIDRPAREGDDDPRCGVSSLQKFDGEDLPAADRGEAQMQQCKQWWQEQAAENDAMKANEAETERAFADVLDYQQAVQRDAALEEIELRRRACIASAEENKRLAEEQRRRQEAEHRADLSRSLQELDATLASALLTEDPRMAVSAQGPNRVRREHWKGMTDAERAAIRDTLFRQVEEKKAKRQAELEETARNARHQHESLRLMHEKARAVEDFKRQQDRRLADFQKRQMLEKQDLDASIKSLYANQVAPEYFMQFGTSHR